MNYARTFDISDDVLEEIEESKREHISFKEWEIQVLYENINTVNYADVVYFQCYSGFRPQELGLIRIENVDLDKGLIIGGMKTESGRNRVVPIHDKVKDIVSRRYKEAVELGSEYLFNCTDGKNGSGLKLTYDKYKNRFNDVIAILKINQQHRPHDPRKTFVTMCKNKNVDEYAIKYIVGHKIKDLTERVYTEREIEWLQEEIKKI